MPFRARELAVTVIAIAVAVAVLGAITVPAYSGEKGRGAGLLVVVTFPNLVGDVEQLLCSNDHVEALAPPGVDPHEYQLGSRDVDLLSRADLVVSTGHAPFENDIRELVEEGRIKARLLEIPSIPGIVLKINPATGRENYHMPVYDPYNYAVLVRAVAGELARLRPECSDTYWNKSVQVLKKLAEIVGSTRVVAGAVVADTPVTQYAVEWTGLRLEALLVKEHGAMASPSDIARAEQLVEKGAIVVVVDPPVAKPSTVLLALAEKHGAPVIRVPSPFAPGTVLEKLEKVAEQVNMLQAVEETSSPRVVEEEGGGGFLAAIGAALSLASLLIVLVAISGSRKGW